MVTPTGNVYVACDDDQGTRPRIFRRFTHLHTPKLDSGLHRLRIPCGGCTVIPNEGLVYCSVVGIPESPPIQHDDAVPVPVTRRNPARLVGANHKSPIKRTTDAHANSLAPWTANVARKNGFGGLSHRVKLLVHAPGPIVVDLDYATASTTTAVSTWK